MAADSARGPVFTACAQIPAVASDGGAQLLLDRGPVVEWRLTPLEIRKPARIKPFAAPRSQGSSPEPPPPRFVSAL
jgi:hypothetical protein